MKQRKDGFTSTKGTFFVGQENSKTKEFANFARLVTEIYEQGKREKWGIKKWTVKETIMGSDGLLGIIANTQYGTLDKRIRLEVSHLIPNFRIFRLFVHF